MTIIKDKGESFTKTKMYKRHSRSTRGNREVWFVSEILRTFVADTDQLPEIKLLLFFKKNTEGRGYKETRRGNLLELVL